MGPKCVWAPCIFFEQKMDWALGRQGKKEEAGNAFVLLAIWAQIPLYVFSLHTNNNT